MEFWRVKRLDVEHFLIGVLILQHAKQGRGDFILWAMIVGKTRQKTIAPIGTTFAEDARVSSW